MNDKEKNSQREFDLEDRLVKFAVSCIELAERLPRTFAGRHLGGQLIRSSTSAALNYGEAQSAESRKDFIHKIKIVLKELRESRICIKIIINKPLNKQTQILKKILKECNELIAIFVTSVSTAEQKKGK